jgi:hypothetical protein
VLTSSALEATIGKHMQVVPWETISAVWFTGGPVVISRAKRPGIDPKWILLAVKERHEALSMFAPLRHVCLELMDESALQFPSAFSGFGLLCAMIQQQTLPHLLRLVETWLETEETVLVGSLEIGHEAVAVGGQSVAWRDIEQIRVSETGVDFYCRDETQPRLSIGSNGMPNLHVLLNWVAHEHSIPVYD